MWLSKENLKLLVQQKSGWCISLYMPTHRTAPHAKENVIRFKNLIREAEERLKADGVRGVDIKKFLTPASELAGNSIFWQHQADGLAVFLSRDTFSYYRLPLVFEELLILADRFHIKPLFPLFVNDGFFYVLALSQNGVRLMRCTRHSADEVSLEGLPKNLAEALKYDEPQKQLQHHTGTAKGTGQRATVFHGHGTGKDESKDNILIYFQQVDHGLKKMFGDLKAPVVLAGVDYLLPMYRDANSFLTIMEKGIEGSPEGLKADELQKKAWGIVEPHFRQREELAAARFDTLSSGEKASADLREIIPEAYRGRVEVLFVPVGLQQWGVFNEEAEEVVLHSVAEKGDEDLLNLAAIHTFLNGGTVYAVEPGKVPGGRQIAALYRY